MQKMKEFRCPFEVKGVEEGTIIDVALGPNKSQRLAAMTAAFIQLRECKESPAIRFTLPSTVLIGCISIRQLRTAILPYQAEAVAADLDTRLRPFLLYQRQEWMKTKALEIAKEDPARFLSAFALMRMLKELGIPYPKNIAELATWIEAMFETMMKQGFQNPQLKVIGDDVSGNKMHLMTIQLSNLTMHADYADPTNLASNKNCFSIVKAPLYPESFGRYSRNVEIVVSREADFTALSREVRERIRTQSNTVYREHGVHIVDLANDKQNTGLWEPEFK